MRRRLITAPVGSLPQGNAVQHNDKTLMTA